MDSNGEHLTIRRDLAELKTMLTKHIEEHEAQIAEVVTVKTRVSELELQQARRAGREDALREQAARDRWTVGLVIGAIVTIVTASATVITAIALN